MGAIEWNAALETNHPRIDEQHRALLQAFNQLHAAVLTGRDRGEGSRTLLFLTNYSVQHFRMEEELMDQAAYPDAPRHKKLHHDLVVRLSSLMKGYMEGTTTLSMSTLEFMEGWLVEHIQGEDFRLAEFLRATRPPAQDPP